MRSATRTRTHRRLPATMAAAAALVHSAVLAGCGGEQLGTGFESPADQADQTGQPGSEDSSVPTLEGTRVRLVNMYLPEGDPVSIDVLAGLAIGDQQGVEPFLTVAAGEASEYFEPPSVENSASFSLYPQGKRGSDDELFHFSDSLASSAQWTVLLVGGEERSDGRPGFGIQTLDDHFESADPLDGMPAPKPGKGQIVGSAVALHNTLDDADSTLRYGTPGAGCLEENDDDPYATLHVAGTYAVPFDVDPGQIQIAAYDAHTDHDCAGDPVTDPVEVEVADGARSYVFAWTRSGDPAGRELMVLPID